MKNLFTFAILLFLITPAYAEWEDHGLNLFATDASGIEGAFKYGLRDNAGHTFFINSAGEPDSATIKKIIKYKDDICGWKHTKIRDLSFYRYDKGIQCIIVPSALNYKDTDLKPYLPSGFSFAEEKGNLNYKYRIIVKNTSLKLDGNYKGEESLLEEMLLYIKGIKEEKIIVEDEKVVSGSVVSLAQEKEKGDRSMLPVGYLTEYSMETKNLRMPDRVKIYFSGRIDYLRPLDKFGDLFIGGYGFNIAFGICNAGFSLGNSDLFRFDFELFAGYWKLNENEQKDNTSSPVDNAYVIPAGIAIRYPVGITNKISIVPSVAFGYFYNRLDYVRTTETGTGEKVSARELTPSLMPGLRLNYRFAKIFIFAGTDFFMMFERRMNIASLVFNAGTGFTF